jgi:hypothetical protein
MSSLRQDLRALAKALELCSRALYVRRGAEDLATRYPVVDATAVIANQKPTAPARFHRVQMFMTIG